MYTFEIKAASTTEAIARNQCYNTSKHRLYLTLGKIITNQKLIKIGAHLTAFYTLKNLISIYLKFVILIITQKIRNSDPYFSGSKRELIIFMYL